MDKFTVWEKILNSWEPAMTFTDRESAVNHAVHWARDFAEEHGEAPQYGRDFRVTQEIKVTVDVQTATGNGVRPGVDFPGTLHAGADVPTVNVGVVP